MDDGVSGCLHHLVVDASLKYGNCCYASRRCYRLVCAVCLLFCLMFFVLSAQQPDVAGRSRQEASVRRTLSLQPEPLGPRLEPTDLHVRPFGFDILQQPSPKGTFRSCQKTELLIVVCSAVGHLERRSAIRETWGSEAALAPLRAAVVFALGVRTDQVTQAEVQREAEQFGDVLQGDFDDTYMNLTLKSTMALKYVGAACGGSGKRAPRFILKTDDDVFVNVPLLLSAARKELKSAKRLITGCIKQRGAPQAVGSDGRAAPSGWPDFAAGAGYLMTGRLAAELYQAARRVAKPSKMEDIFVTAQCAQLVPGAHPPKHDPRFTCGGVVQDDCKLISMFTGHHITPQRQVSIWDKFTSDPNPCMDF